MKFTEYFIKETNAKYRPPIRWRIKASGVRGLPEESSKVHEIIRLLEEDNIYVRRYEMSSPANVNSHHLEAKFSDGGLSAMTGSYFYDERGTWITGLGALEYICTLLNIEFPKKLILEKEVLEGDPSQETSLNNEHLFSGNHPVGERITNYADSLTAASAKEMLEGITCTRCIHGCGKRVSMFNGKNWCDLKIDTHPHRCDKFQTETS